MEYCFQCSTYPCQRYSSPSEADSFITYRNVITDFEKASREGLERYQTELNDKIGILEYLIDNYNDGRRKNYYCMSTSCQ